MKPTTPPTSINPHEDIIYDPQQLKLSTLKKQFTLSKSQLLQFAYDDQKFINKLQQLNNLGYEAMMNQQSFNQALVYLTCAQNILQYAASCGKTIDRNIIIATLQNQASVYHRMWQLQKAVNYIQAIVYNISSFLQNQQGIDFKLPALQQHSQQNIKTSIYLKNKLQLVFYYLQFCAVSSQNQSHQTALSAASKALSIIKQVCQQEYNLQRVARKNGVFYTSDEEHIQMLLQLCNINDFSNNNSVQQQPIQKTIQKFLLKAKKIHQRYKTKLPQVKQRYPKICTQLQHYSIGYVMQINPIKLPKKNIQQQSMLDLKQQLQFINKIYKAIYISICHFTMATELRLMSGEKFPIDPQMRRASFQFKSSQLHHLIAIVTAGLYIPCETVYYQHILNSFRNHYGIDLTQKDSQISLTLQNNWNDQDDDLIHLETSSLNLKKDTNQSMDSNQFLVSNVKLKNSVKKDQSGINHNVDNNIPLGSPELYSKMKKGMSKNKFLSTNTNTNRQSQKSLKKSAHQHTYMHTQTQRIKSKSKDKQKQKLKSTKKSNLKQSKSRKKSSRKIQQNNTNHNSNNKLKSPSIHKKNNQVININYNTIKKISEMREKQKQKQKQKKNSDIMKIPNSSRSKNKSKKKMSRSKHQLQDSKEKVNNNMKCSSHHNNHYSFIPTPSSSKKLLPPSVNSMKVVDKEKVQRHQKQQKHQQKQQKHQQKDSNYHSTTTPTALTSTKTLSNNVYIQRSNNQVNKQKITTKKQSTISTSGVNSEGVSQKVITLKKNKSPVSMAISNGVIEKQSRSVKKVVK